MNVKTLLSILLIFSSITPLFANSTDSIAHERENLRLIDSFNNSMKYQTGSVMLANGIALLEVPNEFKFLNAEQSNMVITDVWGNPKQNGILGMIFPANGGPLTGSYAFVVTYDEIGYVKDEDADKINYDDLLKQMQDSEAESNKERQKNGYPAIHMDGWAQKPFYDKKRKVLHWAKSLHFQGEDVNTLNYDVRLLGRKGVLSLNAVATIDELYLVNQDINKILEIPRFTPNNQYDDFKPGVDEVAAYTIGGLVAGKVLAKVGFFALLLKFWKLLAGGIVVLLAGIRKFFGFKSKKNDPYENVAPAPLWTDEDTPAIEQPTAEVIATNEPETEIKH